MTADTRSTLRVLAVGLLIFFVFTLALSLPFWVRHYRMLKQWSRAQAVVVSSQVMPVPQAAGGRSQSRPLYEAAYQLSFTANGKPVTAAILGRRSRRREVIDTEVSMLPAASRVGVLYNPADPGDVRMHPGYNAIFFAVPLFITKVAGVFAALALVLLAIAQAGKTS